MSEKVTFKFTSEARENLAKGTVVHKAGKTVKMDPRSAERWARRGAGYVVTDERRKEEEAKRKAEEEEAKRKAEEEEAQRKAEEDDKGDGGSASNPPEDKKPPKGKK